jgi:hypothetical protein
MKKIIIAIGILIVVVMQGCVIKSLHPFYHAKDLVFREELINSWVDSDGGKWSIRRSKFNRNTYEMHWLHNGERDVVFAAHLFKLGEDLYLDFFPEEDNQMPDDFAMFSLHLLPVHSVAKVHVLNENEVTIKWFNEDWMNSLFEQNRIKISHESLVSDYNVVSDDPNVKNAAKSIETQYVLTASTDELQKFLIKYGNEDKNFDDENTVWLKLKRDI